MLNRITARLIKTERWHQVAARKVSVPCTITNIYNNTDINNNQFSERIFGAKHSCA